MVTTGLDPSSTAEIRLVDHIGHVVAEVASGTLTAAGVDMPIGLASGTLRSADQQARQLLGRRRSSMFTSPPFVAIDAETHAEATALATADTGKGLSMQSFRLFPRIREVRQALDPSLQPAFAEVHPETSFAVLAGEPLAHPKKDLAGVAERCDLLEPHFPTIRMLLTTSSLPGVAVDDLLDAYAAAWTARRMATGEAVLLGDAEARDKTGFRLTISA